MMTTQQVTWVVVPHKIGSVKAPLTPYFGPVLGKAIAGSAEDDSPIVHIRPVQTALFTLPPIKAPRLSKSPFIVYQFDAIGFDVFAKGETLTAHSDPPLPADESGAKEHIVHQRHVRCKATDGVAKASVLFIHDQQDVNIRVGVAVASRL